MVKKTISVEDRIKQLETKIAQQNEQLAQKQSKKSVPSQPPKKERVLSTKQKKYNEYKEQQWALFKAKGSSFKNMLKDSNFQAQWKKISNTL
jgi:LAS superfamily LD-carboxypeptidase LdcB